MSILFNVRPCDLMCFDQEQQISEDVKAIEMVQHRFGKDAVRLLDYYTRLNDTGKKKVLETLEDMTDLPKYTE